MSQIPNLENAPINLTAIRARTQSELETILKNIRGNKCLVIDPQLSGSLSLLLPSSELKKHGAELRHLTAEPIQTDHTKVVYLVRAQLDLMKFICSYVQMIHRKDFRENIIFTLFPAEWLYVLEEEKVHSLFNIGEFPLYLIPLDEDVLSFELDLAQKEYLVDGDATCLWHIAKAIHNMELSFGVIPNVRAKGKGATRVADILSHMQAEEPVNTSDIGVPEINTLILLDREVDMVTPMCSQLTYEGLLDELVGVSNGAVEVDASIMGVKQGEKIKVPINSSDKLHKEIRDLNFEVVLQVLRQKATSMKEDYTEISTTVIVHKNSEGSYVKAANAVLVNGTSVNQIYWKENSQWDGTIHDSQTVSELKDFVKKLNSLPEITRHINLAHHLSTFTSKSSFIGRLDMEHTLLEAQSYDICFEYVEEMIHKQEPLVDVLRLLVLFSVTNSGLPKKNFDYLRREFLHSYGFEHIATLNNLEKAGLLRKQDSRSNWLTIKRSLQLVVEDSNTANPNDISYVFSGYAPLSIRLVQQAIRSGCHHQEILKLLPGPHTETKKRGLPYETHSGSLNNSEKLGDGRRSLVFVVFIGGVTFAEISALRFLSSQEGMAYDLIVGTTKIVNGRTLIQTFVDKLG